MNQSLMEYRARRLNLPRTSYISFSKIKTILESPAYFWAAYSRGYERPATQAMLDSKRIDQLLLEPQAYKRNTVVAPFEDFRSFEAIRWRKKELAQNPGAFIITESRAREDQDLLESVMSHPEVANVFAELDWLRHGYATDPQYGLLYSETDLRTKDGLIGDVKAVESVDRARFTAQMERMRWYVQLGFYGRVDELITGRPNRDNKFFLAVEKEFPYRAKIYTLTGDYDAMADKIWQKGADMIRSLLDQDPHFQNRALWFSQDHQVEDLRPSYGYVNYGDHAEDFSGLQLGG